MLRFREPRNATWHRDCTLLKCFQGQQASAARQSMADQAKGLSQMMERYELSAQAAVKAAAGGGDDWTEL